MKIQYIFLFCLMIGFVSSCDQERLPEPTVKSVDEIVAELSSNPVVVDYYTSLSAYDLELQIAIIGGAQLPLTEELQSSNGNQNVLATIFTSKDFINSEEILNAFIALHNESIIFNDLLTRSPIYQDSKFKNTLKIRLRQYFKNQFNPVNDLTNALHQRYPELAAAKATCLYNFSQAWNTCEDPDYILEMEEQGCTVYCPPCPGGGYFVDCEEQCKQRAINAFNYCLGLGPKG